MGHGKETPIEHALGPCRVRHRPEVTCVTPVARDEAKRKTVDPSSGTFIAMPPRAGCAQPHWPRRLRRDSSASSIKHEGLLASNRSQDTLPAA